MTSIIEQVMDKIGEQLGFERTPGQANRWGDNGQNHVNPYQNNYESYSHGHKGGYIAAIMNFLDVDRKEAGRLLRVEWGIDDSEVLEAIKAYKKGDIVSNIEEQPQERKNVFTDFVKTSFSTDSTKAVAEYFNKRGITSDMSQYGILRDIISRIGVMAKYKELEEKILVPTYDINTLALVGFHSIITDPKYDGVRKAQHGEGSVFYFFPHLDHKLTKSCSVFEGWEDAMVYVLHLLEIKATVDFQIVCTFGSVTSKIKAEFIGKYDNILWFLDADDKGDKYFRAIREKYGKVYGGHALGKFQRQRVPLVKGVQPKDFSDWYLLSHKQSVKPLDNEKEDLMVKKPIFNVTQAKDTITIDFETYSEADLVKWGLQKYAKDPSTKVLMCAYMSGEMKQPDIWAIGDPVPDELRNINRYSRITAYNAEFEYMVWNEVFTKQEGVEPLDLNRLECSMALARRHGLIGSLSAVLRALGLENKDSRGSKLIQWFSIPSGKEILAKFSDVQRQEAFGVFKHYCKKDVAVEIQLQQALPFKMEEDELFAWRHTVKCNERGIHVDVKLLDEIIEGRDKAFADAQEELIELTGIENKSVYAVKQWIKDNENFVVNSADKKALPVLLQDPILSKEAKRALVLVSNLSSLSLSKADTLKACLVGDRYHGVLMYYGAITGRWTGTGVQMHNLPKEIAEEEFCSEYVNQLRHLFIPDAGEETFYNADFSSVENRVMAYVCNDAQSLQDFEDGIDQYRKMASIMFHKPYESVAKDSKERQIAKSAVLGCQYGMGAKGYRDYAKGWGVELSEVEAKDIVDKFRDAVQVQTDFRYALKDKAILTVLNPMEYTRENPMTINKVSMFIDSGYFIILLPTGRELRYYNPVVDRNTYGQYIKYQGAKGKADLGLTTLINNVVQGMARDLLLEGLKILGDDVIFHVHDEFVYKKGNKIEDLLSSLPKEFVSLVKVETEEKPFFSK